jgi:hypothetical protein
MPAVKLCCSIRILIFSPREFPSPAICPALYSANQNQLAKRQVYTHRVNTRRQLRDPVKFLIIPNPELRLGDVPDDTADWHALSSSRLLSMATLIILPIMKYSLIRAQHSAQAGRILTCWTLPKAEKHAGIGGLATHSLQFESHLIIYIYVRRTGEDHR